MRPILETSTCTGEMLFVRDIRASHLRSSSRNKHKQSKVRILEMYSSEKEKRGHPLTTNQLATNHVLPNKKTKKLLQALKHSYSLKRSIGNDESAVVQYCSDKKPHTIDQFQYIKIQPKKIDFNARLLGINPTNSSYSHEPRTEAYCFRLNFGLFRPLIRSCKVANTEINGCRHSHLNVRFFDQVSY